MHSGVASLGCLHHHLQSICAVNCTIAFHLSVLNGISEERAGPVTFGGNSEGSHWVGRRDSQVHVLVLRMIWVRGPSLVL